MAVSTRNKVGIALDPVDRTILTQVRRYESDGGFPKRGATLSFQEQIFEETGIRLPIGDIRGRVGDLVNWGVLETLRPLGLSKDVLLLTSRAAGVLRGGSLDVATVTVLQREERGVYTASSPLEILLQIRLDNKVPPVEVKINGRRLGYAKLQSMTLEDLLQCEVSILGGKYTFLSAELNTSRFLDAEWEYFGGARTFGIKRSEPAAKALIDFYDLAIALLTRPGPGY